MGGKLLKGSIATVIAFLALPSIAALFSYDERWTNRLNVLRLFQDESLQARTELVSTFLNSLDLSTFIFGDGVGTHSRGSSAIDNGYLALVLEVGFPMALLISLFISSLFIGRIKNYWENDFSVLSVATLSVLANSSFAVISGSSSVFLVAILSYNQAKEEGNPSMRIAIYSDWWKPDLVGGAEQSAYTMALALQRRYVAHRFQIFTYSSGFRRSETLDCKLIVRTVGNLCIRRKYHVSRVIKAFEKIRILVDPISPRLLARAILKVSQMFLLSITWIVLEPNL